MGEVAQIVVPAPPDLQPTPQGAETANPAYSVTMPALATDSLVIALPDGREFRWQPSEMAYRGTDDADVWHLDPIIGSAPASVALNGFEARYARTYPDSEDVFLPQAERVKHSTVIYRLPRGPAVYLVHNVQFGVGGIVSGVTLPLGEHEIIDVDGFRLPRPTVASPVDGSELQGIYEVLDNGDGTQTLYTWFEWAWFPAHPGPWLIDPTVSTSTSSNATAYSNQRKIVRCKTVVSGHYNLVAFWLDGTNVKYAVSADDGTTFGAAQTLALNGAPAVYSFAVDLDPADYLHVIYRGLTSTTWRFHYELLSPNAARDTWTSVYNQNMVMSSVSIYGEPSITAVADGSNYVGFIAGDSRSNDTGSHYVYAGWKLFDATHAHVSWNFSVAFGPWTGSANADANASIPAPDASGNVVAVWSAGATGTGLGIRASKGTRSAGPIWTWGSQEAVDESNYAAGGIIGTTMDGSDRAVVAYKASSNNRLKVMRRATAGTWSELASIPAITPTGVSPVAYSDDVYVLFTDATGVRYVKYTAASGTWGSVVTLRTDATAKHVTARRETAGARIDCIATTGSTSPYSVVSDSIVLNTPPTEPTLTLAAGAFAAATGTDITITHNDADQLSAWALKRVTGSEVRWWNNTTKDFSATSETWNAGSGFSVSIAAADNANDWSTGNTYSLYAATKDSGGLAGPYNTVAATANVGDKPVVTVTAPAAAVSSGQATAEWTADQPQGAYQVRLLDSAGSTVIETTGKVLEASARARRFATALSNGTTYKAEVTVWDQTAGGGVASDPALKEFAVSFTPPASPTVAAVVDAAGYPPHIDIAVTNPAPGGSQPSVAENRIERSTDNFASWTVMGICDNNGAFTDYAAASGVAYKYRAAAIGSNGTETAGAASSGVSLTRDCWWFVPIPDPTLAIPFAWNREASGRHDREYTKVRNQGPVPVLFTGGTDADVLQVSATYVDAADATPHSSVSLTREQWRQRFKALEFIEGYLTNPEGATWKGYLEPPAWQHSRNMVTNDLIVQVQFQETGEVP